MVKKNQGGIKYILYFGMNTVDVKFLNLVTLFYSCAYFIIAGSSTQTLQTSVIKLEDDPELALILERKNKANPQGEQTESNKKGDSNTQRKPGIFILGGQPGYSHQPVKLESFNQQGKPGVANQPGSLQGNSGESNQKGSLEISIEPGKPGSSSQQGKPGSSSQQGKPGSSGQQGESGSSSQQGKPGSASQQGKPGLSNQQRKPKSFYNQEERKNVGNPSDGNMKSQVCVHFFFFFLPWSTYLSYSLFQIFKTVNRIHY